MRMQGRSATWIRAQLMELQQHNTTRGHARTRARTCTPLVLLLTMTSARHLRKLSGPRWFFVQSLMTRHTQSSSSGQVVHICTQVCACVCVCREMDV